MSTSTSPNTASGSSHAACTPAAPPSRSEIERKLSFRSNAGPPRGVLESPKKPKRQAPPGNPLSGNDSDSSSIASATYPHIISPTYPPSPLPTPGGSVAGSLTGIVGRSKMSPPVEIDEAELEDVEEEGDEGEGEESEEVEKEGGDMQRGMEGERVMKSGYLLKKQERRKAWKRKWFVLRTNKLAYYKDDREYSLKRVLDLKSVQAVAPVTVKKHSFSFGIVTAKRTFLVKASSQDEMDDWVRAINSARRRLSEAEEEARAKRTGSAPTAPVTMPTRDRPEPIDTHMGTFSSVLSSAGGSFTASPTMAGGYFAPRAPSMAQASPLGTPAILQPSSPMDKTTLTGQMSAMSLSKSPSVSSALRMPSGRNVSAVSARRDTSASSIGSSDQYHQHLASLNLQQTVSSDEDEPFFSDPQSAFQAQTPAMFNAQAAPVDPNKVILSAYLMKRSKGRGRKVWRKRWFYLTSQGLTYTKSHMDARPVRFIPLTAVLDALEFDPDGSGTDVSDSDLDAPSESSLPRGPSRQFSMRSKDATSASKRTADKVAGSPDEHLFRIVTAKRTFVLCAPSEEDEIKWLAAFRALLTRQREWSSDGAPMSPVVESSPKLSLPQTGMSIPYITQQPPTPNSATIPSNDGPPTPSVTTSAGPPILGRPFEGGEGFHAGGGNAGSAGSPVGRGRSATYIAKGAVADVVRRYHPEQKDLSAAPQHV